MRIQSNIGSPHFAILVLTIGLGSLLLPGCRSDPFPAAWAGAVPEGAARENPVGLFANHGTTSDPDLAAPTLSALLFADQLEGFAIDRVLIREGARGRELLIIPMVGQTPLENTRLLAAQDHGPLSDRWTLTTPIDYLDGYTATASVFWTGGTVLPLAAWGKYSLRRAADGALLIELKERMLVDFFYFFPVRLTDQTWLRYPLFSPEDSGLEPVPHLPASP